MINEDIYYNYNKGNAIAERIVIVKRILILSLVASMLLGTVACSRPNDRKNSESEQSTSQKQEIPPSQPSQSPEEIPDPSSPDGALKELLQAAGNWELETVNSYLPTGVTIEKYLPAALEDTTRQVLERMEYTVGDVNTTGNNATVKLKITAVNLDDAVNSAINAVAVYVAAKQFKGETIDNYNEIVQIISDSIDVSSLPTTTKDTTAYMIKGADGDWKLDLSNEDNLPLLNAASGGAVEIAKKLKDMAENIGIQIPAEVLKKQ